MAYILAILGIVINFLSKYNARTKKDNFSVKFWIKDNWPELIQSLLFVIAIMIMLDKAEFSSGDFYTWVRTFMPFPDGVIIPVQLFAPFLMGLSINHIVYWYNKRYLKKQKTNE
jgi:hypothetical protein